MKALRLSAIVLATVGLGACSSITFPPHGQGGFAEWNIGMLSPLEADQNMETKHGLRFDLELTARHLDMLVQEGAEMCFPATVAQAKLREARITRELKGGLPYDAANDIVIQRETLARLERQLDYVKSHEVCVLPKPAGETTSPVDMAQRLHNLLNSDNQFATDSHELNPKYVGHLAEAAALLKDLPQYRLKITGHADQRGDDEKNKNLSTARAEQVGRYLQVMGIMPSRIETAAVGATQPFMAGDQPHYLLVNRRVTVELIETTPEAVAQK